MKNPLKTILYGALLWVTVFVGSFLIFPLKQSNPIYFETFITIILCSATVMYGHIFFRTGDLSFSRALRVGLIWAVVNLLIDLPLFSFGPMKKTPGDYAMDIGLTYLVIPIILTGFASRKKL
jgi:hypothetical protein